MKIKYTILSFIFLLATTNVYSQKTSLLWGKTLKIDYDSLRKANGIKNYPGLFSDSITVIPLVFIYPEGKGWGSEVYDYDYEYRVLLRSGRKELATWTVKNPNDGEEVFWIVKDAIWEAKSRLNSVFAEDAWLSMIDFVGTDKQLYFVCFFPDEIHTKLPVIGYIENGRDVFVDSQLRKHKSLKSLLNSRYGSVSRYRELYGIYKQLAFYNKGNFEGGSRVRIISKKYAAKEVPDCVEKYQINGISGHNIKDRVFKQSGVNTLIVRFYDEDHILYWDMARNETRIGELAEMEDFFFYGDDFLGNYDKGNCNE